jgi:hypothetical protein
VKPVTSLEFTLAASLDLELALAAITVDPERKERIREVVRNSIEIISAPVAPSAASAKAERGSRQPRLRIYEGEAAPRMGD